MKTYDRSIVSLRLEEVAERINTEMFRQKINVSKLAQMTGLNRTTITKNISATPNSNANLVIICEALGLKINLTKE